MKKTLLLSLFCLFIQQVIVAQSLKSPNGKLEMEFSLQEDGTPVYSLTYKDQAVVKPSKLGFDLRDEEDLLAKFTVSGTEESTFDQTWEPVWGEEKEIRNHYNELEVNLLQKETEETDHSFQTF